MVVDDLKFVPMNRALTFLQKNLVKKVDSPFYIKNYGEKENRKIYMPENFIETFRTKSSTKIPVLNLGGTYVNDINQRIEKISSSISLEKMVKVSRKLGEEYLLKGIPSRVLPKNDFEKTYVESMQFLDVMLGVPNHTIKKRQGYALYWYDKDAYPFEEGSKTEKVCWGYFQGLANGVHSNDKVKNVMSEKITHERNKVIIESKTIEEWAKDMQKS